MKTFKLMTACAATLLFASCLQMEEPASIEALRNAKTELIAAEVQYMQAQTAYKMAEAAYQQALADNQVILNKIEELRLAKETAQNEKDILEIEQAIEALKMQHEIEVLQKKTALAQAEQAYADALAVLAEQAKGISNEEQNILDGYMYKLNSIKNNISSYQRTYENAVNNYIDAQHSFTFDYEMYKAKYLLDVTVAEKNLETANEFVELLAGVNGTDYMVAIAELKEQIEAEEEALKALEEANKLYEQQQKQPHQVKMDEYDNISAENYAKIADLELQQKHLFMDDASYYKIEVMIPATLAGELYSWFDDYNYIKYTTGFVKDEVGAWTTVNNRVVVQFPFYDMTYSSVTDCIYGVESGMMANFLKRLANKYEYYKDYTGTENEYLVKQNYYTTAQRYLTAFEATVKKAKDASLKLDEEINKIKSSQLEVDLLKSALKLEISKVNVELAAKQKEYDNREDALEYVKALKETYESFVLGTEAVYPVIRNSYGYTTSLENINVEDGFYVTFETGTVGYTGDDVEKVLEKWAELAEFSVLYAEQVVAKAQAKYEAYTAADSPMVFAQQTEIEAAEMAMIIAEMQYEYYKAQFDIYSTLFNEFLAKVIAGEEETTTPEA